MRIVSLAPSNTEILFALGVGEQVVAVTKFCDWPKEATDKIRIGSWLNTDAEKLKELKPDLIFTSYWLPEPLRDWSGPGKLIHVEPKNLWDVLESIRVIGEAVSARAQAKKIIDDMEQGFEALRAAEPARKPRVYMEEWFDPPMVAGNWVPELVAIAGGEAVMSEINQPSKIFSLAALTVADPDLVICHWCGWGERVDEERILARAGWEQVRAVHGGYVYFVNDSVINRPGPRLVEGAKAIQSALQEWKAESEKAA